MTLSFPRLGKQVSCPLLMLVWLLAPQVAPAQPVEQSPTPDTPNTSHKIRVTLPWGIVVNYPVVRVAETPCLTLASVADLLADIDEKATLHWDPASAVCQVDFSGNKIVFYGDRNVLVFNDAVVPTRGPLLVAGNSPHLSLSVLEQILRTVPEVETNIADFESAPTPQPAPPPPPPPSAPRFGVPPKPLPTGVVSALAEALPQLTGSGDASPGLTDALRRAAEPLLPRQAIVLDPQPNGGALPGADVDPPDVTLDIARRCREILEQRNAARVVLTRDLGGDQAASVDERLRIANTAGAKALVCLRIDWSPFPQNKGLHRYAMHEAVVPKAPTGEAASAIPPVESAYRRYQNIGLLLGQILESRMIDAGHVAADRPLRLLPAYMLKRAAMPSATLVLGYWSNPADRALIEAPDYVETTAQALAAALTDYSGWLAQMEREAAP